MKIPEKLLSNKYRRETWKVVSGILKDIQEALPVASLEVMGSFATKKKRPADVDFIVLLKTKKGLKKKWSVDFVMAPDNAHGKEVARDARKWMSQKYGAKNFELVKLKQKASS